MNAQTFLTRLTERGVVLYLDGDSLKYRAPAGVVTPDVLSRIRRYKEPLIACLSEQAEESPVLPDSFLTTLECDLSSYEVVLALAQKNELPPCHSALRLPSGRTANDLNTALMGSVQQWRHFTEKATEAASEGQLMQAAQWQRKVDEYARDIAAIVEWATNQGVSVQPIQTANRLDHPGEFDKVDTDTRDILLAWIAENFTQPSRKQKTEATSYGLKHDFEDDSGLYVTNGQFKGAMLSAGYQPVDAGARNWHFYALYKRGKS